MTAEDDEPENELRSSLAVVQCFVFVVIVNIAFFFYEEMCELSEKLRMRMGKMSC